jgi:hypothetical protein
VLQASVTYIILPTPAASHPSWTAGVLSHAKGEQMKRTVFPILVLLVSVLACGQPATLSPVPKNTTAATANPSSLWYRTRGEAKSDQAWGVGMDSAGNIYTAGYYQSPASALFYDMVIYKFSPDGTELWRTQWGGKLEEKAFVVWVQEPYIYVGGTQHTSASFTEADMAILELDMATGQVLWSFTWGQGFGYQEVDGLVAEGNYLYASGWTTGKTTGGDIAILKLNRADGSLIWAKTWGTGKFDSADGQMVVDENNIYISGRTEAESALFGGKAMIAKFDKASGEYLDHRTWGGPIFNDGLGMTSDGISLYVVGMTMGFGSGSQIFLLKYDKSLNLLWQQLWGGPGSESARAAAVDASGNILVAGNTDSYGSGKGDIALLSFSPEGSLNWSRYWGGPLNDAVQGLALFGNFVYLVGSTENNSAGMNDALLIKADSWTGEFPLP